MKNTPKVRFKGFSGEWEEKELAKIAEFNPKSEIPFSFKYVDLESVIDTTLLGYKKLTKLNAPSRAQRVAKYGDIFYQTVRPYQKNNLLFDMVDGIYVFSTGYAQLRPVCESYYLLSLLQGEKITKAVLDRCTGTSYPAISSTDLSEIETLISKEKKEQTKIGDFFKSIDTLITKNQQKHEKLTQMKKALLEKMFPKAEAKEPEIRFQDFSGEWEEKELGTEVEFYSGLTYSPSNIVKEKGTLVLRSSNIQLGEISLDDNVFVNSKVVNCQNVKANDIIVVVRNGSRPLIGKHAVVHKEMLYTVIGAFMTGVRAKNYGFINVTFDTQNYQKEIEKNLGATINQITTGSFKKMLFKFPSPQEQAKIGELFRLLDKRIALQQEKIKKLKNMKRAFLAKMFV